ncbi:hypothetical protein L798_09097 [Zootermopsis nevadensis]|uniref:Uncharacterized protein n=1 Tax=Zootermopsis nevadensis TaxID=136037 RepID=A0A067R1N7_ZOONE|nr:hypothetical protein L798_09097 [Zootermopsis nevadensis]
MLENIVYPQLQELQPVVFFQQDDMLVPSRGPADHRTSHPVIFPMGYVKQKTVYRTPVADINDLKDRTAAAIATVDFDMLQRTWMELEHRLDIVHVTNGAV